MLSSKSAFLFYYFRMYGRLGNAEPLSGLAYGGIVMHDISGQLGTPFLG